MVSYTRSFRHNAFCASALVLFLGYLSLSFVGEDNKVLRIISCFIYFYLLFNNKKGIDKIIWTDPLVRSIILFFVCCLPSLLFTDDVPLCAFKLFELSALPLFIGVGVKYFKMSSQFTIFDLLLWYFVVQTGITILGYFLDPSTIAAEEDYSVSSYVTFLVCKYPPLHANGLGSFAAVSLLFGITNWVLARDFMKKKKIIIFWVGVSLMSISVLYLTSSRTSMISALIAFLFLYKQIFKQNNKVFIAVATLSFCVLFADKVIETATSIIMKKQNEVTMSKTDNQADLLTSGRLSIWATALDEPEYCILGRGYGTAVKEQANRIGAANAHNSIVELLISSGIFSVYFWLRMWWYLYKRYKWLILKKDLLPFNEKYYHLSAAILLLAGVKSFGNLSFVYMQLDMFALIAVVTFFLYSTLHVNKELYQVS